MLLVDAARWNHPLALLSSDRGDEIEVGVVVEHDMASLLGRGGDQQVRDLPTPLAAGSEHALHLACPLQMLGCSLDQHEGSERTDEIVPLPVIARRVADLEIADPGAGGATNRRKRFDDRPHRGLPESGQYARVEQMAQRHASPRSATSTPARTSSALVTRGSRPAAAIRSASLTVSLIVTVPSSARAALSAGSSISTRCLLMPRVYTQSEVYIQIPIRGRPLPEMGRSRIPLLELVRVDETSSSLVST